ncbi:MAG: hypothetical protein HYW78_00465 [Parcubacteria group bacterium]|nr:hypothetical protein [Parcubacteria group bacterium]
MNEKLKFEKNDSIKKSKEQSAKEYLIWPRLYHGTTKEYLEKCQSGEILPPTITREYDEDENLSNEYLDTDIWFTNDPHYAANFGDGIVMVVAIDPKQINRARRGSPGNPSVMEWYVKSRYTRFLRLINETDKKLSTTVGKINKKDKK